MRAKFLEHDHIYFRPIEEEDFVERYYRWINDPSTTRLLFRGTLPTTKEDLLKEYRRVQESDKDILFAIVAKEKDIHFGFVGLHRIEWVARHAEHISFFSRAFWGRGYAKEMMDLSVGYGFDRLNLNKIYAGVNAANLASIKMCERNGWKHEGIWRQHQYRDGKYYDAILMSILREEFYSGNEEHDV